MINGGFTHLSSEVASKHPKPWAMACKLMVVKMEQCSRFSIEFRKEW